MTKQSLTQYLSLHSHVDSASQFYSGTSFISVYLIKLSISIVYVEHIAVQAAGLGKSLAMTYTFSSTPKSLLNFV
jgi:hypothetical protein